MDSDSSVGLVFAVGMGWSKAQTKNKEWNVRGNGSLVVGARLSIARDDS